MPENKKLKFVCSFSEDSIKALKCSLNHKNELKILAVETHKLERGLDEKTVNGVFGAILKRLGLGNNHLIISLPRSGATCRYLKIPSQKPEEIESITGLQASKYLPYPNEDLVTGYEALSTNPEGYSNINLVIAHKDTIQRYARMAEELKIVNYSIFLSSYGLVNFYNAIEPKTTSPVILIDIDADDVQAVITCDKKVYFSRYFKIYADEQNREGTLNEEINKTKSVFSRELSEIAPEKVIILRPEFLSRAECDDMQAYLIDNVLISGVSIACLIGLALKNPPESLNLLPREIKKTLKKTALFREYSKIGLCLGAAFLIWMLAFIKNVDNKKSYLERLNSQLSKACAEAAPLAAIESKIKILENNSLRDSAALNLLLGLHQDIPSEVTLISFYYEENSQVSLKGEAPELNSLISFVSKLQNNDAYKGFDIRIKYAARKKTAGQENIEFEIECLKK